MNKTEKLMSLLLEIFANFMSCGSHEQTTPDLLRFISTVMYAVFKQLMNSVIF